MEPGEKVDKRDFRIIERMPVELLIPNPADGAGSGHSFEVRWHARPGDRTVAAVEVSREFGSTWMPAGLDTPADEGA